MATSDNGVITRNLNIRIDAFYNISPDFLYHLTWITDGNGIRGDVFHHDGTGSNRHIVTNPHARQDGHAATYPHIVANGNGPCSFPATVSLNRIDVVTCRIDTDVRTDEAVVADSYGCFIQYGEVEIGNELLAYTNLLAEVATEGLVDNNVVIGNMSEKFLQDLQFPFLLRRTQVVVVIQEFPCSSQFFV